MTNYGLMARRGGVFVPTLMGLAALTLGTTADAANLYVNPGQSVQAAIDAAAAGDSIIVRPGTYDGSLNLRGKRITLRGEMGADRTTLTSSLPQTSVMLCNSGETWDTIIEGFTVTGGTGSTFGYWNVGGGMRIENSSPTIRNCVFRNNSAGGGGGMLSYSCSPRFANCTFRNNISTGSARGGGVRLSAGFNVFLNCIFTGNEAYIGGAIDNRRAQPLFVNCTITANHARGYGGAMHGMYADAVARVSSSIIWNNTNEFGDLIYSSGGASFNIDHSIVQGGWAGTGNMNTDPMFKSASSSDFRLLDNSPAIDAGNESVLPSDFADLDGDDDIYEIAPFDMDLAARTTGMTVDMGAYEMAAPADDPIACIEDFDGNLVVDLYDLFNLLQRWGPCSGQCAGDADGNNMIDIFDLMSLLAAWGNCEA